MRTAAAGWGGGDVTRSSSPRVARVLCLVGPAVVLLIPLLFIGKALFTSRVTAPLDLQLLMEPWKSERPSELRGIRETQTPLLDCVHQYYPWRVFAKRALGAGETPLWNPHAFCGTPFAANQQSAVFYPPNLLFWLLPLGLAYDLAAYLALVLAGLFTWGLCRDLGLSRPASALAALGFVSSGYMVVWLCYMGPVNSFLWGPAGMWAALRFRRTGRLLPLVGLAFAAGMTVLGGHAQAALYALALMGSFAALLPWLDPSAEDTTRNGRALAAIACALAVGLGLALIQALPTLELALVNYRTAGEALPAHGLQLRQLNVLVAPQAHGNIAWLNELNDELGFHNYVETCGYVGLLVVWLAVLGAVFGQGRIRWHLAGCAAAALVFALEGPHQAALRALLPPLEQMSNVGRSVCVYGVVTPILAGYGLDALVRLDWTDRKIRERVLACGLVTGCLVAAALSVSWGRVGVLEERMGDPRAAAQHLGPVKTSLHCALALALAAALVTLASARLRDRRWAVAGALAVAVADALVFAGGFQPAVDARLVELTPPTLQWLREHQTDGSRILALKDPNGPPLAHLFPNLPTLAGLNDVNGYDSLYPRTAAETLRALDPETPTGVMDEERGALLDRLGVRYLVTRLDPAALGAGALAPTARPTVHENPDAWPVAYASTGSEPPQDRERASLVSTSWTINARRLTPESGDHVWLAETAYPGWKAYAGGSVAPLRHPTPTLKGAACGAGGSVDLVYEPGTYTVGAFLSLVALAGLSGAAAAALAGARKARRR